MPTPTTGNYYDYNLWAPEDDLLTLSAYEFEYDDEGDLATNTSKWIRLDIPVTPDNEATIKWLLELFFTPEDAVYGVYQDLDAWDGDARNFTHDDVPEMVREWARHLPEYTH